MADLDDRASLYGKLERSGDQVIANLALRHNGVVATWQLKRLGYTDKQIHLRAKAGRLHRRYRGVYAVGHPRLTAAGRRTAAAFACGPDAVLSHASAAAHWELRPPPSGPINVTVPGRTRRGPDSIRVHGARTLDPREHQVLDGVPITSIHRTLLDYAEVASRQQVRLAVEAAERLNVFDLLAMNELLGRSPGRRGLKVLKELLAELTGPAPWTQSELERQFLALIRTAGLPEPEANVLVGGELVDFYWPGHPPLVVELDGYQFHRSRAQFEKDRRRDAKLQLLGCRVVRITQRRLKEEPEQVIRELTRLLYGAAA